MGDQQHDMGSVIDDMIDKHKDKSDLHITRALGAIVVVSDGRVIDVDRNSSLRSCPMQSWFGSSEPASYVEEKIEEFGHFRCSRQTRRNDIVAPYGTSEMFMKALERGVIDCAITVSDGAGSVITEDPSVVQGVGARMNGVFYTTPIKHVIEAYRNVGCIVFDDGRIDQTRAIRKAASAGYRRIAVTVNAFYGESLREIRRLEGRLGVDIALAAVCSTGVGESRAREMADNADIGWSCASRHVRNFGCRASLQLTYGIPIFIHSIRGLELIAAYSDEDGARKLMSLDLSKQYILASDVKGERIAVGKGHLYLAPAALPIVKGRQPEPLR